MKGKKRKTKKVKVRQENKKEVKENAIELDTVKKAEEPKIQEISNIPVKEENKKPADYSKQTRAVVIFMVIVLLAVAGAYYLVQKGKISEFNGIEFQKTNEGTLVFYKSLMGYVTSTGEEIPFILKLRINPNELQKIPAQGNIDVLKNATITMSPQILACPKTYISSMDLAITLKAFGTSSIGATTDEDYAREKNVTQADCTDATDKTVIVFMEGDKTQIYQDKEHKNCYIIEINDCEVRQGYERFLLEYLQDSYMRKTL